MNIIQLEARLEEIYVNGDDLEITDLATCLLQINDPVKTLERSVKRSNRSDFRGRYLPPSLPRGIYYDEEPESEE